MKRTVILDRLVWFNFGDIPKELQFRATRDLTLSSKYAEDNTATVKFWKTDGDRVGLPLVYGLKLAKDLSLKVVCARSEGERALYRKRPTPRNPQQRAFFDTLTTAAKETPATFAVAATGTGKTVAALNAIAEIGRTAIVIVPSKSLAVQWKQEAVRHLGMPESSIHIFQGGKCAWQDYRIVVAVIHNLCNREWPDAFYKYFGTVVWDEAHRVGATMFSQSLSLFPAMHRIALTATPNRKDGMTSLLTASFGRVDSSVKGNAVKPLDCTAYVVNTAFRIKTRPSNNRMAQMGMMTSAVSNHAERNMLIAMIAARGYHAGRNVLIISDRIEQLQTIGVLLALDTLQVRAKDISLFISATKPAEVERLKAESKVILATYGMMKEGQDIPRLDMGIDATPRSDGEQMIGRIRRQHTNKKHPIWVTLYDQNGGGLLSGISAARIKDFVKCGARVINVGTKLSAIPF